MEPSELEIRREVEALRDIRRRSSSQGGPGSLPLDPDLPNAPPSPPSPLSPQTWAQQPGAGGQVSQDDEDMVLADPSHLFWVPAHLHPELAPAEFRAFLQQHAQGPQAANGEAGSSRSSSLRSTSSLNRRRSMLSRQYEPKAGDGVEKEDDNFQRKRSLTFRQQSPQLSISDLQKLEELAEEAQRSDDPSKLRSVLRRSLSLNVSPSKLDDQTPDVEDADAPIIVPKPGQILRRAARTKIRKPSLQGDGGGHRFPATRRTQRSATLDSATSPPPPPSEEVQRRTTPTQDDPYPRPHAPTPDGLQDDEDSRPVSFSEESLIFDSYADRPDSYTSISEEDAAVPPISTSPPPPPLPPQPVISPPLPAPISPPQVLHEEPQPLPLHHPKPQRMLSVPHQGIQPQRSPSPGSSDGGHGSYQSHPASPSPPPGKKEKKGGLFKWGSSKDKEGKKAKHQHQHEYVQPAAPAAAPQKEKESSGGSGFFGFFGKKKADEGAGSGGLGSGAGPAAAAALLGPPKGSKPAHHSPKHSLQYGAGSLAQGGPAYDAQIQYAGHYARYPIHVERAVYRLSHIKLANPRRPLYEQVLISNLMFWYLGVINKQQQAAAAAQMQMQQQQNAPPNPNQTEAEHEEQQRREQEEMERERLRQQEEMEHRERERMEWEQQQREREAEEQAAALLEQQQREQQQREEQQQPQPTRTKSGRRALTKVVPGQRRAETPVRGPQYDAQHRVISQEQWDALGIGLSATDPAHPALTFFEQPKEPVAGLPPGAMSPAHAQEQARSPQRPARPRSPPLGLQHQQQQAAAGVSRSLSASAVTPPAQNGRPRRKANSAIAARAGAGPAWKQDDEDERFFGAEEDVPLAVWQQQRTGRR